ncbi:MAG: Xaa-Pro peptidase family protein [Candidatus Woesearchaeota archaeon]
MKLKQLQQQLKKDNLSYLFLTNQDPNFTYFTGLKDLSFALLAIPAQGKPFLFYTALDREKTDSSTKNILIKKSLKETLIKHLKPKNIGYNSLSLTIFSYRKFKKIFPQSKFIDFAKSLISLRREKTEAEIIYLKKAAKLTDLVFQKIIQKLKKKEFKTENEIKFFLEQFAYQHNTELSFPPIVASGINTKNPHHQTSNKRLTKGFLLLDFGISYQHYCSDMTRVIYLGKPTPKELEIYNLLLAVQKKAITEIKPGKKAAEIDQQVRKNLGKYSSHFVHSLGHGVGVEIHESPSLSPDSKEVFRKNQIFTVEPGIYLSDFGLRIEDTLLLTEKPQLLTKSSKELLILSDF